MGADSQIAFDGAPFFSESALPAESKTPFLFSAACIIIGFPVVGIATLHSFGQLPKLQSTYSFPALPGTPQSLSCPSMRQFSGHCLQSLLSSYGEGRLFILVRACP